MMESLTTLQEKGCSRVIYQKIKPKDMINPITLCKRREIN